MDYLKLYDLERYLFDDVKTSFHKNKKLCAFDFFCIIIWKTTHRVKSKIACKLLEHGGDAGKDLNRIVGNLTSAIAEAENDKERMRILIQDWKFFLPTATAILTVMYPESFTVYDRRVCDELRNHHKLKNKSWSDALWDGYRAFLKDLRHIEPAVAALRDKDRTLWAKSFEKELNKGIATRFAKRNK